MTVSERTPAPIKTEALQDAIFNSAYFSSIATDAGLLDKGALYGFQAEPWDAEALRDNVREAGRHHRRLNADRSPRSTQVDPVTV